MSKPMFRPKRKKVETDTEWLRKEVEDAFSHYNVRVRDDEGFDVDHAIYRVVVNAESRGHKKMAEALLEKLNQEIAKATAGGTLDFGGKIANRVDALNFCKAIVSDAARTS